MYQRFRKLVLEGGYASCLQLGWMEISVIFGINSNNSSSADINVDTFSSYLAVQFKKGLKGNNEGKHLNDIRENDTAKNTVISPNFLVWIFCGKA